MLLIKLLFLWNNVILDECKLQKKSHLISYYETLKSTRPKYGHMVHTCASDMDVGDEYTDCLCAIDYFLCKRANVYQLSFVSM